MSEISEPLLKSVAVIGSGYWGKNLVRNFYQIGALRYICDKDKDTLLNFKKQYPDVETVLSFSDLLNRDDVDGIVIATPAETHFSIAREALLAGKHVYVEKPIVLQESEGNTLIELADKNNVKLMVGHLLQYHPAFIKLKQLVKDGELGRLNYICSNRLNFGKIRTEENILWSFAPHDISMILSLTGENPEAVYSIGANYLHKKIADVTTTHLEFPSGIKAHIFVSWLHPFKEQNLIVIGDRKMAVFNDTLPWAEKLCLYSHQVKWQGNIPVPEKAAPEYIELMEAEPLREECEHFIHCMSSGENPRTDGREGLNVLKILNASQQSLDESGKKINLKKESSTVSTLETTGKKYFSHSTAIIDDNCTVGSGTKIWHFSHVLSNSRIGENCNIGQNVVIGPDVAIGNNCKIQNNVSVYKGVTLEDGVFCGPSMVFTNVYTPRAEIRKMDQSKPTLVKRGATIGANATIVCGNTLGEYCFVGAGTLVNKNVPAYALVVGNPSKQIGWVCECGERMSDNLECTSCGKKYKLIDSEIVLNN